MHNKAPVFATVDLEEPINRGDTTITSITLRRPNAGELRGLSVIDLVQMKTDALFALLPRISDPMLTPADLNSMNPADFMQLGTSVAQFHVPKKLQGVIGMMTPS